MNRYRFLLAVVIALVIVVAAVGIHPGRLAASQGTLYITPNDVSQSSGTVTYKIYVDSVGASSTSGINGWNLVVDDHDAAGASLTPVSVSVTGNALSPFGTVTEVVNCVNGGTPGAPPGPGNSGCDIADGPGIIHTAAVLQGPATPTPISGLIATITYTAASSAPTTLGFVATASEGDILSDGTPNPVVHTTRGATFSTTSPDFVITATDSPAFNPGGTGSSTVTLKGLNGFTSSVSLSHTEYPSTGLTVNCPTTGAPSAAGATVNCSFSSTTPGAYVVTLTGTSGSTVHLAPISVNVGDFSLGNPLPNPVKFNSGSTGTTKIIVRSLNGFSGSVSFGATTNPTTGLTVDCGAPVTVSPTASPTVTCTFSSSTPATYTSTITGTFSITGGGTVTHSKSVSVTVMGTTPPPDFTISPSTAVTVQATVGTAATQTITLAAVNGFTGTVSLSINTPLPAGLTCNAIPSVTLPAATMATLSCTAAMAGDFPVTVKGTSGTLTHSTGTITFHAVVPTGLTLSANPNPVNTNVNVAGTSTITVNAPTGTTGAVTFQVTPSTGLTCDPLVSITLPGTTTATLSCKAAAAADYTASIVATVVSLTSPALTVNYHVTQPTLSLSANPNPVNTNVNVAGTSQITVTAPAGTTGAVAFVVTPMTGLTCDPLAPVTLPGITTTILSCKAAVGADYTVGIVGSVGSLTGPALTVNYHVTGAQTLSLAANPNPVSATVNVAGTSTITVTATGGLTGAVIFTVTPQTGLTCPAIASITLPAVSTATLSCTAGVAGSYTAQVTGAVGTVTSSAITVTFNVASGGTPDFDILSSASSLSCNVGGTATSTISITPKNGFTGTVSLTATSLPPGLTATLNPTSISGTTTSTLTVQCSTPGQFTISVRGAATAYLSHSVSIPLTITGPAPGFTLSAQPTTVTCNVGDMSKTSMITVTAQGGFTGTVALAVQSSMASVATGTLSSMTVNGGAGSVTLNINCISAGPATLTVAGTSGSLTPSSATVMVTVSQPVAVSFSITAAPTSLSCIAGGSTPTSTITVTGDTGFEGVVMLTATVSPSNGGITVTLSNAQVTGSGTSMLNVHCVTAGTYMVNVEGMSGLTIKHAPLITVTVTPVQVTGDFSIVAKPSNVTIEQGDKARSTITVTSLHSFTGTVNLSTSVSCTNVHADLSRLHLEISKDSSNHTKLMIKADANASLGTCTVTITGLSGSLSHTATVKVKVVAEEKNECVGTGDDDNGHHKTGDDKTASKDRDDDECGDEGHGGHECVGTGDNDTSDHGHHDKMMGKDKDDNECDEEGHGHECKGHDDNGLGDDKNAMDKDMRNKDDCMTKCHGDNESVEGAEHENSKNACATSPAHGTDHDDNKTSTNGGHGSRDNDNKNGHGECLVSLTDSDHRVGLSFRNRF